MTEHTQLLHIFTKGDGARNDLYELASSLAKKLAEEGIKHHQFRNILDYVIWAKQSHPIGEKELSEQTRGRIATLRPRITYAAARQKPLQPLRDLLDPVLKGAVKQPADLDRLYDFAAALVAYHKYWEPIVEEA